MPDTTRPNTPANSDSLQAKLGGMTLQSGLAKDADGFFTTSAEPSVAPKTDSKPGEGEEPQ